MKTLTKTLVALTALVTFGSLALAGPGPGGKGGHHGPGHHLLRAVKDLDLSETQRTEIRAILDEGKDERREARTDRREQMQAFKTELLSDAPNAKQLHQMADKKHAERGERLHERIDDLLAVVAILTPDQRADLSTRMDEMADEMPERRDRRPRRD